MQDQLGKHGVMEHLFPAEDPVGIAVARHSQQSVYSWENSIRPEGPSPVLSEGSVSIPIALSPSQPPPLTV